MEFDFTAGVNHLRNKDWSAGHCYFVPTLILSWDDKEGKRSTSLSIKWLFIQFGFTFTVEG